MMNVFCLSWTRFYISILYHYKFRCLYRKKVSIIISSNYLWKHQLFVGVLMSYLPYLCLLAYSGVQHILCFCFVLYFFVLCTLCCQFLCFSSYFVPYVASFSVFLRIVYSMLPVSLFFFVLCTLCCQFLCFSSYCVPYVASFSGLFICDCHFGII
jgi:hypothetical protein